MAGRRLAQEINAGTMADIAFLLLVFFLVTTTMDTDVGILRRLPPPQEIDVDPPEIKQRNVFVVLANANDQLLVEGKLLHISQLKEEAKEFILNPYNKENLPEKRQVSVAIAKQKIAELKALGTPESLEKVKKWNKRLDAAKLVGEYWESKQVISLQNDRGTSYGLYVQVQNELAAAYSELRDEFAMEKFGRAYDKLPKEQAKAVKTVIPQKISEAEPVNIGGK